MRILFLLLIMLNFVTLSALEYISHDFKDNVLEIKYDWYNVKIEIVDNDIFSVSYHPHHLNFKDYTEIVDFQPQMVNAELSEYNEFLILQTDSIQLKLYKQDFGIEVSKSGQKIAEQTRNSYFTSYSANGCKFSLDSNEAIYGLGMKAVDINRRNMFTMLYNQNVWGYKWGDHWLNTSIPMLFSSNGYAVLIDGYALGYYTADDLPDIDNYMQYHVEDGRFKYFMIIRDNYAGLSKRMQDLTGYQPMLPRWAMGYFLSKYAYSHQDSVYHHVDNMKKDGFPIDALVLDYSWFGKATEMGNFTWDSTNWYDPEGLIEYLDKKGINTILISEPYIAKNSDVFEDAESNELFVIDSGKIHYETILGADVALLDIYKSDTKQWIWNKYKNVINKYQVSGWWVDLIEPELHPFHITTEKGLGYQVHNYYSVEWAKNMYQSFSNDFPDVRPYFLFRSGWTGSQKYGVTFQCGDELRSWDGLKGQIPAMLGLSLTGAPWFSTDIGGFAGFPEKQAELYSRWMQFGAFTPIMRSHVTGSVFAEPNMYEEPYLSIHRDYVKWRYKLLPYNYTLMYQNHAFGLPPARQSDFYHPKNEKLQGLNFQYLWGDAFLVAPVIDSGARSKEVVFPPGKWIEYGTGKRYDGNQKLIVDAPLERLPLFVKAGSIIPTAPEMQSTKFYNSDSLIIEYFPEISYPESSYIMFNDDGIIPDTYSKGQYELLDFTALCKNNEIRMVLDKSYDGFDNAPEQRNMQFVVHYPDFIPGSVFLDDILLGITRSYDDFQVVENGYYYDFDKNILHIKFNWDHEETEILIDTQVNSVKYNIAEISEIYPNPAEDHIKINIDIEHAGKYLIEISDINGKIVKTVNTGFLPSGEHTLSIQLNNENIRSISKGVYVIRISSDDFEQFFKFVK